MALYTSTLITENIYGGNENISIQETSSLNQLLKSFGQEKLIIRSLNLWTDNAEQLNQVIIITESETDGNSCTKIFTPQKDSYQTNNNINNYSLENLEFDQNSKFEYTILANTSIKITLNFSKYARRFLSKNYLLETNTKNTANNFIYGIYDIKEKEEIKIPMPYPSLFKEPEENPLEIPALYTEERKKLINDIKSILENTNLNDDIKPFFEKELYNLKKILNKVQNENINLKDTACYKKQNFKKKANNLKKSIKNAKKINNKIDEKKKIIKKPVFLLIGVITAGAIFGYLYYKKNKK